MHVEYVSVHPETSNYPAAPWTDLLGPVPHPRRGHQTGRRWGSAPRGSGPTLASAGKGRWAQTTGQQICLCSCPSEVYAECLPCVCPQILTVGPTLLAMEKKKKNSF